MLALVVDTLEEVAFVAAFVEAFENAAAAAAAAVVAASDVEFAGAVEIVAVVH